MTGYHIVRRFVMGEVTRDLYLPEGWKPFAYDQVTGTVICRKWVRSEKETNGS